MIPDRVLRQINEVSLYTGDCDDWVTIKKEIMKGIPSHLRKSFSRRDPISKEQVPNNFDLSVINYYNEITGITLKIRSIAERKECGWLL
tara:strand:- start:337 stop:603 length:267 start_codon:yes stop_codon:yes gene_type:complete